MPSAWTESDLLGADLVLLLSIEWAGATWRFSSRPLNVTDADGVSYQYIGGLDDLDLSDEMALFSDTPSVRSVPIKVLFPVDVAELVALGHDLGAATGELSIIRDGDPYEDRLVFVDGYVSDPEYGDPDEPDLVNFSLEENPWDDAGSVLDDRAVVKDAVTWTYPPDGNEGAYYPLVFGRPGPYTISDGTLKDSSGTPALLVQTAGSERLMVIAGHRTEAGAEGTTVEIFSTEYNEWIAMPCSHAEDNLGRTVTVVDGFDGYFGSLRDDDGDGAAEPWTEGDSFWVSWNNLGGIQSLSSTGYVEGAGDLLELLLNRTTLRLDRGRIAASKDYLNQVRVAGYIDEQGHAYDAISDLLLPILPCVSMTAGPDGIYPVVFRFDSTASNAVAELVEGPEHGLVRDGPVAYEGRDDVVNELTLSYAMRARTGEYHRTRTISGDPGHVGLTDYLSSAHARQSHLRYGRKASTLSTPIIYETASADLVCLWHVLAHGFAHRAISLIADQRWGWLNKGDVVVVTSDTLHLAQQVGLVRSKRWSLSGFIELEVVLLEDPARDLRLPV